MLIVQHVDVFNGDADGICALHQLRLCDPVDSVLVTGPKREIDLLKRVEAGAGSEITVLDIALSKNRVALDELLRAGARVRYFDHHQPGEIPVHPRFESHINTDPKVCTSLLVDRHLSGRQRVWAITAAFGDNLAGSAREAADGLGLTEKQLGQLQSLGECLNYNGYGETIADLFFDPADLYTQLRAYADPFAFLRESHAYATLREGYAEDISRAREITPIASHPEGCIYMLPAEKWARRVSGVFANELSLKAPARAHAVLTAKTEGAYVVSVRAPKLAPVGADEVCSQFETGGGRCGAAGINHLTEQQLERFMTTFIASFKQST